MGKKIFFIVAAALFLHSPIAFAHGGTALVIDNALVYVTQNPISPLVGETVRMNFLFQNTKHEVLPHLSVSLRLIDTYYGNESKDAVVLTREFKTDENGSFDFSYTFPKQNYFDVELSFRDPVTGKGDVTGILVQPRMVRHPRFAYYVVFVGGILLSLVLQSSYKKWFSHRRNPVV